MKEKLVDKLKRKKLEKEEELYTITKAIEILEREPDWAILMEAMNH